jgi:hypothetical protein
MGLFKPKPLVSDADRFLTHLESVFGRATTFGQVDSRRPNQSPIKVAFFKNVPQGGNSVAVTCGLARSHHPDWKLGRPELMVAVNSLSEEWGYAIAELAESLRGTCPFSYGNTLNLGRAISAESTMSGFVVFAPSTVMGSLTPQQSSLKLSETVVNLVGMYPIHPGEAEVIQRIGLKDFWHRDKFEPWDVRRPNLALSH